MSKCILVSGVAGFIASRVAEMLLDDGWQVIGVDNLNPYYNPAYKRMRVDRLIVREGFSFHELDIEHKSVLDKLFASHPIEAVINLAGMAGVRASLDNPYIYFSTNTIGTLNVLELMKEHGVEKYVTASTSSVYSGLETPFHEDLHVNTPISPYAASKKAAEVLTYTYHYQYDIDVSILRYFTVYGPSGRPDMSILRFIRWMDNDEPIQLYGDGEQSRDFTYIDDIARGTILSLKKVGYEVFNLGGGNNPVSINNMILQLEDIMGKIAVVDYLNFHKADVQTTWAEIGKAKELLGWEPRVSLNDGLKKSVQWYLDNKDKLKDIPF